MTRDQARQIVKAIQAEIEELDLEFSPINEYDVIERHVMKLELPNPPKGSYV